MLVQLFPRPARPPIDRKLPTLRRPFVALDCAARCESRGVTDVFRLHYFTSLKHVSAALGSSHLLTFPTTWGLLEPLE